MTTAAWEFNTKRFVVRYKDSAAEVCRKHGKLERRIGAGLSSEYGDRPFAPLTDTLIVDVLPKVTPNTHQVKAPHQNAKQSNADRQPR